MRVTMTRKDFTAAPRILIVAQDPWSRDLLAQLLLSVRGHVGRTCRIWCWQSGRCRCWMA